MINQHNSVIHVFSVPNWLEMCVVVEVLTVLLYYRPPGKFTVGEIVKMLCQELDIYYQYMYMTLSVIDMDFLYRFNLRLIAPLFTVKDLFMKCLKIFFFQDFQKLAGLWLVGKMYNHVGIYGSKVAEGFSAFQRRSCHDWKRMNFD